MRILVKYFFWLLSLISLVIFYLLSTTLGHANMGYFLEDYLSEKMENKIKVSSLNFENYPYVIAEMKINDGALFFVEGSIADDNISMKYSLKGESLKWNSYLLNSQMDLKGEINGIRSKLLVSGEGKVFEGTTKYAFVNTSNELADIEVHFTEVNAKEVQTFLKYKNLLEGKMNIDLNFDYFTSYRKKGQANLRMNKALMPEVSGEVEFSLDSTVIFKDLVHEFSLDINSDIGKLRIGNGHYNRAGNILNAEYGLHIKELAYFEDFLKHKYQGALNTAGKIKYDREELIVKGDSTSYGGVLEYEYKHDYVDLTFYGVSLEAFLRQLSYPPLLSAKIYGSASYDIADEIILLNTKLKKTRFRRTKMTDKIYEVTGIDIRKDVYDDSVFTAGYEDNILTSFLKIDNGVNHLYLRDTKMNSKTNGITANFEVKFDEQKFVGEIYGTLDDPKVNLDMSKLIKYQIHKKIQNFFGRGRPLNTANTKEKLSEMANDFNKQVDNLDVDLMEEKTRSFLDGFFD